MNWMSERVSECNLFVLRCCNRTSHRARDNENIKKGLQYIMDTDVHTPGFFSTLGKVTHPRIAASRHWLSAPRAISDPLATAVLIKSPLAEASATSSQQYAKILRPPLDQVTNSQIACLEGFTQFYPLSTPGLHLPLPLWLFFPSFVAVTSRYYSSCRRNMCNVSRPLVYWSMLGTEQQPEKCCQSWRIFYWRGFRRRGPLQEGIE
jgi:hypothetical protein